MNARRILIIIAAGFTACICLEIGSYCLLSYVLGGLHLPGTTSQIVASEIPGVERLAGDGTQNADPGIACTCIHPYLGYTLKPAWDLSEKTGVKKSRKINLKIVQSKSRVKKSKQSKSVWYQSYKKLPDMRQWNERANEGLSEFPEKRVFLKRDPSRVIISVFGGSFAQEFSNSALQYLLDRLHQTPELSNREFIAVPMALGGYKQPQQLIGLNYYLALGAEFDVVINLDGFNEVAIPATHNGNVGLHPFYPMNWTYRLSDQMSVRELRLLGEIGLIEDAIQSQLNWLTGSIGRFSSTASLVVTLMIRRNVREIDSHQETLSCVDPLERNMMRNGPMYAYENEIAAFENLVAMWKRSSIQMNDLCRSQNMEYFHFLQPNQYVPGSKPLMNQDERDTALKVNSKINDRVIMGYPLLVTVGGDLADRDIAFHDLTGIFRSVPEPVYRDGCCHLNDTGYRLVADAMYDRILSDMIHRFGNIN